MAESDKQNNYQQLDENKSVQTDINKDISAIACRPRLKHEQPPTRKKVQRRIITARELLKLIVPIAIIMICYGVTLGTPNIYPVDYHMEYYPVFLIVMGSIILV